MKVLREKHKKTFQNIKGFKKVNKHILGIKIRKL